MYTSVNCVITWFYKEVNLLHAAWGYHMALILVIIASGNGLVPLPEPKLTYHQIGPVAST